MVRSTLGAGLLSMMFIAVPAAVAQNSAMPSEFNVALLEQGEELYRAECAQCHGADGVGRPPIFPALDENAQLGSLKLIVSRIHLGEGAMVAFPRLSADEIAALALYIRNSWSNAFGAVTSDEVSTILAGIDVVVPRSSIWDGVYSEAQAQSGRRLYLSACAGCHGSRLNGAPDNPDMRPAPPIGGPRFLRNWDGQTVRTLFEYSRTTMPPTNPGYLTEEQYLNVIAYMLSVSQLPASDTPLEAGVGSLADILIKEAP